VASVFLGLLQVAQGPHSTLRFFDVTNDAEAVGFFANRNHFAALIYALTLFAAALAVDAAFGAAAGKNWRQYDSVLIIAVIALFIVLVVLLSGQAMARSRTGLLLTMLGLFGAFALGFSDRRVMGAFTSGKLLIGASALALGFALQFALLRILERFAFDPLENARWTLLRNTLNAAKDFMPLGSGLGSFVAVYGLHEKPSEAIANKYVNHAHNDFAEVLLETGVPGVALLILFVIWFAFRSRALWRSAPPSGTQELDRYLARAASIVLALLLAHSMFDYPLRTGAMMSIFGMACAFLVPPPPVRISALQPARTRSLQSERKPAEFTPQPAPALTKPFAAKPSAAASSWPAFAAVPPPQGVLKPAGSQAAKPSPPSALSRPQASLDQTAPRDPPVTRWGADIEWPEEWRKPADRRDKPGTSKPKP
jgi:O-antigen ligase